VLEHVRVEDRAGAVRRRGTYRRGARVEVGFSVCLGYAGTVSVRFARSAFLSEKSHLLFRHGTGLVSTDQNLSVRSVMG
jgi:hypothetical protein